MQKMCRCLLLAVAFVALADGHSLTKPHRHRIAVDQLTTEQKNNLVDKHNELRRLARASDMEKMVSITRLIVSRILNTLISLNVNFYFSRYDINMYHCTLADSTWLHLFLHIYN